MLNKIFKKLFKLIKLITELEFKVAYRLIRVDIDKILYKLLKGKVAKVPFPPRFVTVMLSGYCSQNCVFCCHHSKDAKNGKYKHLYKLDYNMPFDIFQEVVDKCYHARVPSVHICGNGEPTIHPDFLKCLDYVIEKYGHVSFQSNFDHIIYKNKNLIQEIAKREKYIKYITMDLVGYSNETHNPIKKGSNFNSILNIMSSINKIAPKIRFHAHWILTKHNYQGIDKLLFKLKDKNINFRLDIVNLHAYEFNDFCSLESRYLSKYDYITKELNRIKEIAKKEKLDVSIPFPIDKKISKCSSFWSRIQIGFASHDIPQKDWHGNCLPIGGCDAVVKGNLRSFGNLLEEKSLWDVWNNQEMIKIRKDLINYKYPDKSCIHCQNYIKK